MRKTKRIALGFALSLLLGSQGLYPLPSHAAAVQNGPIATENRSSTWITFQPLVEYEALTLTVSGPNGLNSTQKFGPGRTPVIRLANEKFVLPDGRYQYELVATPKIAADTRSAAAADRSAAPTEAGAAAAAPAWEPLSGSFLVSGGAIVLSDLVERDFTTRVQPSDQLDPLADQVILDDLIVTGSACIGFDCVNGESFGFDTLRLKENNLRIMFDDTSSTASFPANDWQLTANDSANGGANKFSIDDVTGAKTPFTIIAGAPSNSIFVSSSGRLGLKTSTPVTGIHHKDGNTPTLRLEQDGSSGFTPQTWDIAGNEANFFVRDATNGSKLPFRIKPNAPSNSIHIDSTGRVGVNTASPAASLDVLASATSIGAGNSAIKIANPAGGVGIQMDATNNGVVWYVRADSDEHFIISRAGTGGAQFILDNTGKLRISGGLVTGTAGSCTNANPCDEVFSPDFKLESIEDHAAYMWANWHLPGVGPTPADAPIDITRKTTGILNELEKAHIYISMIDKRIQQLEAEIARLKADKSAE